jgi:hypothetical protein
VVETRSASPESAEDELALERAKLQGAEVLIRIDVEVVGATAPEQEVGVRRRGMEIDCRAHRR